MLIELFMVKLYVIIDPLQRFFDDIQVLLCKRVAVFEENLIWVFTNLKFILEADQLV